jgi:hypothetical protein
LSLRASIVVVIIIFPTLSAVSRIARIGAHL